jgi:WD40 repeat protein
MYKKGNPKSHLRNLVLSGDIAFSPDNRLLAGWVQDVGKSQLIFFSIDDFSILHRVQYQKEDLWGRPGLDFSPDGTVLAAGSAANVKLWRVSDYSLLSEIQGSGFVKFSPNGQLIASKPANNYKIVSLWQVKDGKEVFSLKGHRDAYDAVFSPDSTLLAIGGYQGMILIRDVNSGQLKDSIKAYKKPVAAVQKGDRPEKPYLYKK